MSLKGIKSAYNSIKGEVNKTPVMSSRTLNKTFRSSIYFKCENFQRVGAFKFRGAYNTLYSLSPEEKERGVITHSSGNHAQAVALSALMLGIKATIVMPRGAPKNKIDATRGYGAEIVFCDNILEARTNTAQKIIEERNLILIHPFDNDSIINGQGTAAYEFLEEVGELDIVITPLGGGGLLSGSAIATKGLYPQAQVYGVEPKLADDALRSLEAGYIIPSTYPNTIADGLRTSLCERTFNYIKQYVDGILTVSELEIVEAMRFLWERMKIIVEPSGAVPLAAIQSQKLDIKGKKIGLILSGGNIDLEQFFKHLKTSLSKS